MNLILFSHQDAADKGVILKTVISKSSDTAKLQIFQTIHSLRGKLKQFTNFNDREIFILLAESRNRLKELTSLIDLLEDKPTILILPDESRTTLSEGHRFFPRYFTFVNDSYSDLRDVLIKMIHQKKEIKPI
jgi:hypothetical protein